MCRKSIALCVTAILAMGCNDDLKPPAITEPPRFVEGPPLDEIGYSEWDLTGNTRVAQAHGAPVAGLPQWQGENPETATSGPPFSCPPYVNNAHFVDGAGRHYKTRGASTKQINLPPGGGGLPRARYVLPIGPWIDDSGEWAIWSGTIDGWCRMWRVNMPNSVIWVGAMHWYRYAGDNGPAPTPGQGDGGRGGWIYSDGDYQTGAGDHGSWQYAVAQWVEYGVCVEGWDIWVDGAMVCDALSGAVA